MPYFVYQLVKSVHAKRGPRRQILLSLCSDISNFESSKDFGLNQPVMSNTLNFDPIFIEQPGELGLEKPYLLSFDPRSREHFLSHNKRILLDIE